MEFNASRLEGASYWKEKRASTIDGGDEGGARGGQMRPWQQRETDRWRRLSARFDEEERVAGYHWAQRQSGMATSKEIKKENGWNCYGCWAEYQKGI
jgi:hypothetical protein